MKLTAFFLFAALFHVSAKGISQNVTFSGKSVSLETVFAAVERQTGFVFMYTEPVFRSSKPVSISVKNQSLAEFLTQVFKLQPLEYKVKGKSIFISSKGETNLVDLASLDLNAVPAITPIGIIVVDSAGRNLSGVTVAIRSSRTAGITNVEGRCDLNIVEGDILLVSSIGYESISHKVTAADIKAGTVNITLMAFAQKLDDIEVTVNTGYQSIPKERATGSFGVVTSKQLQRTPVTSLLERLQGLVPGVDISTKTTAGKSRSGSVRIRGLSTIVSSYTRVSTDPLLVIDGFPSQTSISDGALDFLNPDDIESITFLKDAAAASIWGMQAANGVIVIQTNRGGRNRNPTLSLSTTFGTSSKPVLDYGKRMGVDAYIDLEKELIGKGRLLDPLPSSNLGSYYPENISQAQETVYRFRRGTITETQMNEELKALGTLDNTNQMEKYMLQSPTTRQYNLSLSGGGANNSYFVSGYMYQDDRVYRSNTNKGYSLKASTTSNLFNNRVSVATDLSFSNTRDKINGAAVRAMSVSSGGMRPYDMLKDKDGNNLYYDLLVIPKVARALESQGYLPFRYSPIDELDYSNTYNTGNNLTMNVAVNGIITSWLSANVSGNIGRIFGESETYWEPESYEARILVNKATSVSNGARIYGVPLGGRLDLVNRNQKSYNLRGQLNINKSWLNIHAVNFLIGSEIRENYSKSGSELRFGYDKEINTFRTVNPSFNYRDMYGSTQSIGPTSRPIVEATSRTLSHYTNGSYSLMDKYILSASARLDDSNLLGVERRKRAIPLWSGGLKWDVNREMFMQDITWLDRLAFRLTYGTRGNAPQGFAPVTVINLLGNDFYSGYPNANIASPAVDNLGWEKTKMINYGIDFTVFNNRLSGSVEYYRKNTTDIIWQVPINSTYGFSSLLFNTANLQGKGVDVGLNVNVVTSRSFNWTSTINASYNTNVIKDARFEKPTGSFGAEYLYSGYPSDYLFSFSWAGLDKTGQALINDPKNPDTSYNVSSFPFQDIRVYSGRTVSPWIGMWSNTVRFKGLELNVQLMGAFGGVFRKPSIESIGFTNNLFVGRTGDLEDRWRKPGDEANTNIIGLEFGPGTSYFTSVERYRNADLLVRSRSNIKLQQISLAYEVPAHLLQKIYTKGVTVSAVARNLGMIWAANKEKLDPDYLYTTGNNYQLPPLKNYSLRIAITL